MVWPFGLNLRTSRPYKVDVDNKPEKPRGKSLEDVNLNWQELQTQVLHQFLTGRV
jgi:hypothetical protein